MSRRGDDDGFHPHPGDPWHPGWTSEGEGEPEPEQSAEPPARPPAGRAPAGERPAPAEPRRRRFGRGRDRERPEAASAEPRLPQEADERASLEIEPSGWWAPGAPVGETAWEDRAPATPVPPADVLEEEGEAAPAAPVFPWWGAAAPAAPAPPPGIPPAIPPFEEMLEERPAARREKPGAASVVPLDLPVAPAAPPPSPVVPTAEPEPRGWWEEPAVPEVAPVDLTSRPAAAAPRPREAVEAGSEQAPLPLLPPEADEADEADEVETQPVFAGEGEGVPTAAREAEAPASTLEDDLARVTAALLAELGGEPTVEPLEPAAPVEDTLPELEAESLEPLPWVPAGTEEGGAAAPAPVAVPEAEPTFEPRAEQPMGEGEDMLGTGWALPTPAVAEEPALEGSGLVLASWEPPEAETAGAAPPEAALPAVEETPASLAAFEAPPAAAAERPPAGGDAEGLEPLATEDEVDEWLAFVEGIPAGAPPLARRAAAPVAAPEPAAAPEPVVDWVLEGEAGASGSARPRRRGWFSRRRHEVKPEEEWPERTWAGKGEAEGEGEAEAEAHQPPPWQAPALEAEVPAEGEAAAPVPDEEEEAEAAWAAWETGDTIAAAEPAGARPGEVPAGDESFARPAPAPAPAGWAHPGEEGAEPVWEEGEWAGEPEAPSGDWVAPVDEDEAEVPAAALPEEDWEGEEEPPAAAGGRRPWPAGEPVGIESAGAEPAASAEDLAAAGWELFPEPGKPLSPEGGRDTAAPARGAAALPGPAAPPPVAWPEVGEPAADAGGEAWETFPEPGTPPPRWREEAAGARPVPGPEPVFPEDEAEVAEEWAEEWPEEEPEPGYAEQEAPYARPAGARPGAFVDQPTIEMAPPVFDFERPPRSQSPISEETLTGAVTMEHRGLAEEVAAADTAETELQALSAPMPGLESGVVGFEDVAHLSTDEEMAAPARSDLPVRVVTGMVLAALLLGSLWVGGEFLAGFIGLMVMLGLGEFYGSLRRHGYQPLALFGFLGAIGLLAGTWFYGPVAIPVATVATTVLSFFYYAFALRRRDALTNGGLTLLGMLWVTATAAFAFPIAAAPHFRVLVLAIAATVIATDVGAYFAGRAWGARLMAPVLSPHKTWEGLAGGVVLGIGAAVAAGYFFDEIGIRAGAALGLVVAVMAPLGDLAESMLKRSLGVKDMGAILPGHGGILDRIDAFLFVLPAAWVLFETMGLLR